MNKNPKEIPGTITDRSPHQRSWPALKLSWKLALFTGLLVLFVTIAITFPIYWQTRQVLENQLTEQLRQNMLLIKNTDRPESGQSDY